MKNITIGWRQVRIFTSDFSNNWYFELLTAFAVPFAAKYPETPFWFSRYVSIRHDQNEDKDDTKIEDLKAPYLSSTNEHRSLRFRFCPCSDEEAFLVALFTDRFWHSSFLPFNLKKA